MSTANSRFRQLTAIETDRWGLLLALLFLFVLVGSVWLATEITALGVEPVMGGSSSGEQAAAGAGWAVAEVVVAVVAIGVILAYNRLPEWAQSIVKFGVLAPVTMWLGVLAGGSGLFWPVAVVLVGYFAVYKVTDAFDVYWLWNDLEAVLLAIVLGAAVGAVLPVTFLLVGIIGLTVYDHVFANEKDWMFTLGEGMLRAKLPVIVFALPRLRVDWDDICDAVGNDTELADDELDGLLTDSRGFGIGTADLLLPAAFAASVAVSGGGVTLPVIGVAAGVAVAAFRLRWEMVNVGSGAGLPALTGGMVGGYALALLPAVVLA